MEVGEKYLSISLFQGKLVIAAFPNKLKKKETDPDFKGDGVAVWVNQKQPPKKEVAVAKAIL